MVEINEYTFQNMLPKELIFNTKTNKNFFPEEKLGEYVQTESNIHFILIRCVPLTLRS